MQPKTLKLPSQPTMVNNTKNGKGYFHFFCTNKSHVKNVDLRQKIMNDSQFYLNLYME